METNVFYNASTTLAYDLATVGARASTARVLPSIERDRPSSARQELTHLPLDKTVAISQMTFLISGV